MPTEQINDGDSAVKALFAEVPFQCARPALTKPAVSVPKQGGRTVHAALVPQKLERATDYMKKLQVDIVQGASFLWLHVQCKAKVGARMYGTV